MQLIVALLLITLCSMAVAFAPAGRVATGALRMAAPGMNFTPKSGSSSTKAAPAKAVAGKAVAGKAGKAVAGKVLPRNNKIDQKFGKDMTWGGRPDAAPEMVRVGASIPFTSPGYVPKADDTAGGFLEAPWRYNRKA